MSKRNKILRNTDPSCVQKSSQTVSSRMLPRKRSGGQRGGEQESGRWGAPKFNFDWARRRGETETSVWKFWHEVPVWSRKRWRARINPLLRPIVYLWSVPSSRADTSLSLSSASLCLSLFCLPLSHTHSHTYKRHTSPIHRISLRSWPSRCPRQAAQFSSISDALVVEHGPAPVRQEAATSQARARTQKQI